MSAPRIPNMTELRKGKTGYDERYEIDTEHPLHHDRLVDPREFHPSLADASSYYSQPDKKTGKRLTGVPDAPLVRHDVARRLVRVNEFLQSDRDVREALGAPARIAIADALRPFQVQKYAFNVAWPKIIQEQHPELTAEEVAAQVPNYCARPNEDVTPTPHLSGGAVDVRLMNLNTNEAFDRGHKAGKVKGTAYPDFHEGYHLQPGASDIENSPEQTEVAAPGSEIVLARRVLYYAMTEVGGMYANPTEIWHYGIGDPLSAYVSGDNHPYYGIAELPEWYKEALEVPKD